MIKEGKNKQRNKAESIQSLNRRREREDRMEQYDTDLKEEELRKQNEGTGVERNYRLIKRQGNQETGG